MCVACGQTNLSHKNYAVFTLPMCSHAKQCFTIPEILDKRLKLSDLHQNNNIQYPVGVPVSLLDFIALLPRFAYTYNVSASAQTLS